MAGKAKKSKAKSQKAASVAKTNSDGKKKSKASGVKNSTKKQFSKKSDGKKAAKKVSVAKKVNDTKKEAKLTSSMKSNKGNKKPDTPIISKRVEKFNPVEKSGVSVDVKKQSSAKTLLRHLNSLKKKGESGLDENDSQWVKLLKKNKNKQAIPYKLSNIYKKDAIIEHQNMGVGFVLSIENDRLTVLFSAGIKTLISNYEKGK